MTNSDLAAELAAEQAHIDRAYAVLDGIREGADDAGPTAIADDEGAGGTFQERFERERIVQDARRRVAELRWGDPPLVFGRIDRSDGDRFHIGRVGVFDDDHEPLVLDWRAPAAEGFYRATRVEPLGLHRRRSFHCRGRRLLGIDDLIFDGADDGEVVVGEAALLASLAAPRTGRMGDHVATVQVEQDEVIRAPMAGITIVQGAAGTGKTVVALHRAAYLLYTNRDVLDRQGVLILGPNTRFLDYVRDVLPALGEHDVQLATVDGLFPAVRPTAVEAAPVAALKADLRMAGLIRRGVRTRQRRLREPSVIPVGRFQLTMDAEVVNGIVNAARRLDGTHNARRRFVEHDLIDALYAELTRRNTARVNRMRDPGRDGIGHLLRATPAFRALLERVWPLLTAEAFLHDLFGSPALIRAAAGGEFSGADAALLHRDRSRHDADVAWTDADIPLLHEANAWLGPVPRPPAPSAGHDEDTELVVDRVIDHVRLSMPQGIDAVMEADLRASVLGEVREAAGIVDADAPTDPRIPRVWGSVLVDEAQDLSPMAWRMIARSCPNQAMTIVGDLAQGTRSWSPTSWDDVVTWLAPRHNPRRHELHINYRTPTEIMTWAAPFSANPDSATAVRSSGCEPVAIAVRASDLMDRAIAEAEGCLAADGDRHVAVVAPPAMIPAVEAQVDPAIAVHSCETAKGLEFDAVVVVEPTQLQVGERGTAALYIALTRATTQLIVVHADPLPHPLDDLAVAASPV